MTESLRCPFNQPLVSGLYACRHASTITRRDGPDVACGEAGTNAACHALMSRLQEAALPALGEGDQLPHSAAVKVAAGGLLGVQRLIDGSAGGEGVEDVGALVERATRTPGGIDGLAVESLLEDIQAYRLRHRRQR